MRRRPHPCWSLVATIAIAIAGCASVAVAQQTMSGDGFGNAQGQAEGAAVAASMQPNAAASITSTNAAVVPGSSGDSTTLQGYSSNPTALGAAGTSAATTGSVALDSAMAAQANTSHAGVSATDSWLQSSLAIVANPSSVLPASGSQAQSCTTTQVPVVTTANDGVYTCETTQPVTDTTSSCTQTLVVDTSTAYTYACTNTYDQPSKQWVTSQACSTLASSAACRQTSSTCTSPSPPYFTATQCTAGAQWRSTPETCQTGATTSASQSTCSRGTSWASDSQSCQSGVSYSPTNQTCSQTLNITVGANYDYTGNRSFDGANWNNDGVESAMQGSGSVCQVTASNCTAQSAPQTYTCTTGYSTGSSNQTCDQSLTTTVTPLWNYTCKLASLWEGGDGGVWDYGVKEDCQEFFNSSACTTLSTGAWIQTEGIGASQHSVDNPTYAFACASAVVPKNGAYVTLDSQGYVGTNDDWGVCTQDGQSGCTKEGTVCLDTGGPRLVGGQWITKPCWTRATQYSCTGTTTAAGCSPPTGSTETASSCAATDPGSGACTETNETWTSPTSCTNETDKWTCTAAVPTAGTPDSIDRYVASEAWSTTCGPLASNPACTLSSDVVTDGPSDHTVDGLDITRAAWAKTDTYACQGGTPIDTCPTVPGCAQTGQTCAQTDPVSGQCSLFDKTYSCNKATPVDTCTTQESQSGCSVVAQTCAQNDPATGACALYDETYSCAVATGVDTCGPYAACSPVSSNCAQTDATGACTLYDKTYACWTSQPVDGCIGNVTGCSVTGKTCVGNDANGACSIWNYTYACPANDGSGGCGVKTNTYACSTDIPPADPASSVVTTTSGQHWDKTCPEDTDPTCRPQGASCSDANSTHVVNGISVTEGCWAQTTTYQCEALGALTNDCNPPAGCVHDHDACLDDPPAANGSCVSMDHVYTCSSTSTATVTASTCSASLCVGASCFSISGSSDSNNLGKAYAALSTAEQSGGDYADPLNNLKIMSGAPSQCAKSLTGFSNCCKQSGWGVGLGLASCSAGEKALIKQQALKETHYIGTWCSNSSFFGVCLEKSMRYCVFQGSLARIINEAGRTQIAKTWGSAKKPDCSGFTVAQFALLDLSKVDFSDFYNTALSGLGAPSTSTATANIQATLNALATGATPTNLPTFGGP